jgi:1,4-dihydroxy-2-naphthoate octaprenyltransferase
LVYFWIAGCVILTLTTELNIMPVYCLIAFFTLPFAVKAMKMSREYNDMNKLVPALGSNVQFILITQVLLGIGYILEKLFPLF